jgi:hypothetical protein
MTREWINQDSHVGHRNLHPKANPSLTFSLFLQAYILQPYECVIAIKLGS